MLPLLLVAVAATPAGFTTAAAVKVINERVDVIERCYEVIPTLPSPGSKVLLGALVGPSGTVIERAHVVRSTAFAPDLEACLVERFDAMRFQFPESAGLERTQVLVQFLLAPTNPPSLKVAIEAAAAPALPTVQQRLAEFTLQELWDAGGMSMYWVLLGLLLAAASAVAACGLALARKSQAALVLAGLCWGGAGWAAGAGGYGFFESMARSSSAVAHVSLDQKQPVTLASIADAQIPLRFGGAAASCAALLGAFALLLAVRTANRSVNRE